MKASLVMTVIGDDKPGLVEGLAGLVADHDANWLESRLSHLAGQFAGMVHLEVPAERRDGLVDSLRRLESRGLTVVVVFSDGTAQAPVDRLHYLDLIGQDRPGIVRQISRVLAGSGVNVEELHTECLSAPMSGETLFRASAVLRVPTEVLVDDLRSSLEQVGQDLLVDISFERPET